MDTQTIVVLASSMTVVMALIAILMRLLFNHGVGSDISTTQPPSSGVNGASLSQSGGHKLSQSGANKLSQSGALKRVPAAAEPTANAAVAERFVRVSGHSSSSHHPRELDLSREDDEIHLHVHQHGESHTKVWVTRPALQEALEEWARTGGRVERLVVPGRTARKELPVTFVFRDTGEVEVQADWWVRVGRQELKTALERLGLRVPGQESDL
jgi:hypothetical protein